MYALMHAKRYFFRPHVEGAGAVATPGPPTFQKNNAFRLRQIALSKTCIKKTSKTLHEIEGLQNSMSSRLRKTLLFFIELRLAYAKALLSGPGSASGSH